MQNLIVLIMESKHMVDSICNFWGDEATKGPISWPLIEAGGCALDSICNFWGDEATKGSIS